ncbi:MAG: AMP-binding protein [Rikenellaceae bacterium]
MELHDYTMGGLLESWAIKTPDHDFLVFPEGNIRYSYEQFNQRVNNFTKAMIELGVKPGDKVGVWATNVPDWITYMFACAKTGSVLVTVNTSYKSSELEYILKNADIHTMCIIEQRRDSNYVEMMYELVPELKTQKRGELHSERLPELKNVFFMGDEPKEGMYSTPELIALGEKISDEKLHAVSTAVDTHDVLNMQYTSGTTGFPKGVMLTHHNILNNGNATGEFMGYTPQDKLLVCVPMFHCFGCVLALCAVITHGSTMVMVEEFDPLKVLQSIHDERCTILYGVPTMFIAELNHPLFSTFDLTCLRTGIMAGALCPIDLMNQTMEKMHCNVISVYGLTESSPGMTATRITDSTLIRATTVGRCFPHVDVKVLDPETNQECPVGVQGEMCCKGYNIMKGYYNNAEATDACIDENGYLHSGDLGVMDKDGYFKITGRIKEMIIRGGENIYPREIENYLYKLPQIKAVEVSGIPSPKYGEQVGAFICLHDGATLSEDDVKEFCKNHIARHKIPKYIFFVENYPMTASGKIQKYKLKDIGLELLAEAGIEVI